MTLGKSCWPLEKVFDPEKSSVLNLTPEKSLFAELVYLTPEKSSSPVLTIDGVGAYDDVKRAAILGNLATVPRAAALLLFVRLLYAQSSEYV